MSAQMLSIMEYRYKKFAKVSGEINFRNDITYKEGNKTNLKIEYTKGYMRLLTNYKK